MKSRLKNLLANLCLAVSVCAFLMFLQAWTSGRTLNSRWAFSAAVVGWILCMLLRKETEHHD